MAKMIITGTCGPSNLTRASLPFDIGKGAREAGYEVESKLRRNRMHRTIQRIAIGVLMLAAIGPSARIAAQTKAPTEQPKSLYDRLGGVYSIATVVDDLIERIMIDPRLNANPKVDEAHHRVPPAGFKYLVTEMVCWATGGPQKHTGRSMKEESHQHLMITGQSGKPFSTICSKHLTSSLMPQADQAEIKAVIASTRSDVVV